jgi:site-specific DNA recombinase
VTLRCAVYARYSTDKQRPDSIEDQLRKCREHAERQSWQILAGHIYRDDALSGSGSDRPGFTRLIRAALSSPSLFDLILVDDTSRLSRNLADGLQTIERLRFAGIRVIAVSQGIDTGSEQADVLMTVHGLVDSLYIKELAKKTHRGLEGRVREGFHAGGRCFGYRNIKTPEGVRLEVDAKEAAIVRRIFEMSAGGFSLKSIAKALNAEGIPAPRPRKGQSPAGWCHTAIREMLYRELYRGVQIWNRHRFEKRPGTNKRVARLRPREEWQIVQADHLRIIGEDLWKKVHERMAWLNRTYAVGSRSGLLSRGAGSKYLFSGLLICSDCGGRIVVLSRGKGRHPRWGCPRNYFRGTCSNNLRERHDRLEGRLLEGLKNAVLQPEAVEYALRRFEQELIAQLGPMEGQMESLRRRKAELEAELRRLTSAVAECGHSAFLLEAIADREKQLRAITEQVLSIDPGTIRTKLTDLRKFVQSRLANLRELLSTDIPSARSELATHVEKIVLRPEEKSGIRHYVAVGDLNLMGQALQPAWGYRDGCGGLPWSHS